jgi:hypothetical protein
MAWKGNTWNGKERQGNGVVIHGMEREYKERKWSGKARQCNARHGKVRQGMERKCMVWKVKER